MRTTESPSVRLYSTLRANVTLSRASFLFPVALVMAWWLGRNLAAGESGQSRAVAIAAAALVVPAVWVFVNRRVGYGVLALEAPILLLLLSTLTLRVRTADELAYNPLDPAAQFRVACVVLALMLAAIALITPVVAASPIQRLTTRPFRVYQVYVLIVFAGALFSVKPALTAYRGVELTAAMLVFLGARSSLGQDALPRIETVLYWFMVGLIASVWIGVLVWPSEAVGHFTNAYVPIKWQISGVLPAISANGTGTLGVVLTIWSLARNRSPQQEHYPSRQVTNGLAFVGFITLLAAQYRTGYIALAVGVAVLLSLGRKWGLASVLAALAIGIAILSPPALTTAQPYVLRGTLQQAQALSSRLDWWKNAIPVWEESPIFGRGLLTAARFEVLARLGRSRTSTIHSTWVEALLGTGVVGVGLLALSYLMTLRRTILEAVRSRWIVPLLLMTVLSVRSITGDTFESLSYLEMIFLWLTLSLGDSRFVRRS